MKDLMIIFESTRFDVFNAADTPNLDSLGEAVKATAHGSWTRPSIVSIFSGYLPQSELGQIYNPSWTMLSPEVLGKDVPSFFLNANKFVANMHPRRYKDINFEFLYPVPSGPPMIKEAAKIMRDNAEFFVCLFLVDSHGPYTSEKIDSADELLEITKLWKAFNEGESNNIQAIATERSCRSISYQDGLIKPLLDMADRIIFTADHGELMGENHRIGHDPSFPFHRKLVEVPLLIV